jgi:cellobiose phosphorylase
VWLAHFLAGLCADWAEIHRRRGDAGRAGELAARREALVAAVNEHAWDGAWYRRATRDDGTWIGTAGDRFGRIFLNAQTWAVLSDVAPPERAARCMAAVEEHLVSDAGALLLAPAWEQPDETVGYVTRYAPGLRENGGVYTHAAVWAVAAAAKLGRAALAGRLLRALDPASKDPERYWAEPYVLPGNVDGPQSPFHGRAGWTWYTGSAAWLPRVVSEWVLGVRPTWDGLVFAPCLPPEWDRAAMVRPWRGARLHVEIARDAALAAGGTAVEVDGRPLPGGVLETVEPGAETVVRVRCGPAAEGAQTPSAAPFVRATSE